MPERSPVSLPAGHPQVDTDDPRVRLLKRVFDFDIERCPRSGGRLKIIAAIVDLHRAFVVRSAS